MKKWFWLLLSILVIVIDQLSKYWVTASLSPYQPVPLLPMLNLSLAYNTGAAFGFLHGAGAWHRWFFPAFSLVVSAILVVWLWRTPSSDKIQACGISLILGGALGNFIDRGFQGYVVDFIDFYYKHHHFATFNLADTAICIGAGLLILDMLLRRE